MNDQEMVDTAVISPTKQREWSLPAAANFILGGAGAGFYLLSFLIMVFDPDMSITAQPVLFGMLAPVTVGLGFCFLATEAGRPSRSRYLLCHLKTAWISRETLAFIFFAPAVVLDQLFPHPLFKAWAALSALAFMIAQGFIVYSSRAVPAWNVVIMPLFFLSSGFVSGSGMALLLAASGMLPMGDGLILISMICIMINLIIWILYLKWDSAVDFQSATASLRRPFMIILVVAIGHAFPILVLMLFQIQLYAGMAKTFLGTFTMLSGLTVIIGVIAQKTGIVMSSGYIRKIALKS